MNIYVSKYLICHSFFALKGKEIVTLETQDASDVPFNKVQIAFAFVDQILSTQKINQKRLPKKEYQRERENERGKEQEDDEYLKMRVCEFLQRKITVVNEQYNCPNFISARNMHHFSSNICLNGPMPPIAF